MIKILSPWPGGKNFYLLPLGSSLLGLLVAEGLDTPFAPTAAGLVVSGFLCVVSLVVPRGQRFRWGAAAVTVSTVLSLVSMQLPSALRPEHDPGVVELCALLLIIVGACRRFRPVRASAMAFTASLAVILWLMRTPAEHIDPHMGAIHTALLCCCVLAAVCGLGLRLADRQRSIAALSH